MADTTPPTTPVSSDATEPTPGPSNLQQRIIYGLLGAALLLGCVWFSPWTFGLFFGLVQAIMLWEFYRMMRAGGYAPATWIGIGVSIIGFISVLYLLDLSSGVNNEAIRVLASAHEESPQYITSENYAWIRGLVRNELFALAVLVPVLLIVREMRHWPEQKQPFVNISTTVLGLAYVSLPMVFLVFVAFVGGIYSPRRIFALLFLIWASDIGAYITGKAWGKHKMAPSISPGKTWEGWAGGFLLTLAVGWALQWLLPELPLAHRLVAAGVVAVFAPLGDLAESMLKRSVGVKDSGSIMPGHGGLLDRFDAFLLVLPVLALLQLLF